MKTGAESIASEPGPGLPSVEMHLATPADPAEGVVVASERCTDAKASSFVRHIAFDVSGSVLAGRFRSGQSFGVLPPGSDEQGRPHKVRLYSIACSTAGEDGAGRVVSTTVKRTIVEDESTHRLRLGVASNYLCDLKPGDRVRLTGPSGKRFLLPADPAAHDYVFFATGTGIAPFRGMLADLEAAGFPSRATLVMGSAYGTDLLYDGHFRALAARHQNFRYLTAISRDGGPGRGYVQDRLATHPADVAGVLDSDRGLVYMCGIAGMELGVLRGLAAALPESVLARYLQIDPAVRGDPATWTRRMIHREVRPTRRVFIEVY